MNKLTSFSLSPQAPLASLTDFHLIDRFNVQVTAGAEKTASATGSCKANAADAMNVRAVACLGAAAAIGLAVVLML